MANYKIRVGNLYNPKSIDLFRLSRTRLELFFECPRCFYLDRRLGVGRPDMPGFSLNIAVDALLKKEFDSHRAAGTAHPLMKKYKINAVPFAHEKMDYWRDSLRKGIEFNPPKTNLLITGGVDDIWKNNKGELIIVDYKATATSKEITLEGEYKAAYKRQMEIYQWLFRQNGFNVADVGYFVFVNGKSDREAFDGKLEFDVMLLSHKGDDSWVEKAVRDAYRCLKGNKVPKQSGNCKYCNYISAVISKNKIC